MGFVSSAPILPVQITAADLYAELRAIRIDLGAALTDIRVINAQYGEVAKDVTDHEARLRAVENAMPDNLAVRLTAVEHWQWRAAGMASIVAVVVGLISGYLGTILGHLR